MANQLQIDLQLNIDNAKRQLSQLNQEAQKAFKSGGAGSQSYQQAAQAAAQQQVHYRDAIAQQTAFNRSIADEMKLRQQNMQMAHQHNQQLRQYSPAGQALAGALPGGNILGSGLGVGGTAALAGATALAAAIGVVSNEFNNLKSRAEDLARATNSSSSGLGSLKNALEQSSIHTDISATNPAVVGMAKAFADFKKNTEDLVGHSLSSSFERNQALGERLGQGLGGVAGEQWLQIKQQRADMEQDIGIQRTALQVRWQRQERDFSLSQRKFQVDTANQVFDLQKSAGRQQFDQAIAITKFQENFQNTQATKAYELSRQFAAQSFNIGQGRATQDFGISQGDKRYDYNLSRSRNQQDFNLNRTYSQEDRRDTLTDMALGGASGLDYFRYNRDFNKAQRRAAQQFSIGQGRGDTDFAVGQSRDIRNFGIGMARNQQDFGISQQQAAATRGLELQAQEYARRYEGLQLFTEINRQSQDMAINFQRLNQSIGFQKQGFANQLADMKYDRPLDFANFNLQTSRQRRDQRNAESMFAGEQRATNPLGAVGQGMIDPSFAEALSRNAGRTGQADIFNQFNAANSQISIGAIVGDVVHGAAVEAAKIGIEQLINFRPFGINLFGDPNQQKQSQSQPTQVTFQGGNPTYQVTPGASQGDLEQLQRQYQADLAKLQQDYANLLMKQYTG